MKDGRTHLAHKAEHAVDLSSGAVVAVTLQAADLGDTTTIGVTLQEAQANAALINERGVEEVVADKGYHSNEVLVDLHADGCAQLHSGAGARAQEMGRQGKRTEAGVWESAADEGTSRQGSAEAAHGVDRKKFCALDRPMFPHFSTTSSPFSWDATESRRLSRRRRVRWTLASVS